MAEVTAGEIVALTGIPDVNIGETITDPNDPRPLPPIIVEEPTVRMTFGVNTSPLSGREGTWVTSRKLKERLERELERNVALRVAPTDAADTFLVSGRGELHLAILIETMRREGYEFQVSAPEVILHEDPDTGEMLEPMEEVHVEVPDQYSGVVVEMLGPRKGQMTNLRQGDNGTVYYTYLVPTRGLLGFRQSFLTATRGTGIVHSIFYGYEPYAGPIQGPGHRVAGGLGERHDDGLLAVQRAGARQALPRARRRGVRGDDRWPASDGGRSGAERDQEEAPDQPSFVKRR